MLASVLKANKQKTDHSHPFKKSYDLFCSPVIELRVIKKGEIFSINSLQKMLKRIIENCEEEKEAFSFDNRQLKRWLSRDFPQLPYVKLKQRNL